MGKRTMQTMIILAVALTARAEAAPKDEGGKIPARAVPASAHRGFEQACAETMKRQRACTDVFIPMLVDARIRLDAPKGVASAAAKQGKQAMVDVALKEWQRDSTDAAITQTCKSVAASVPEMAKSGVQQTMTKCLAESACTAFSTCIMPLMEQQMRAAAAR